MVQRNLTLEDFNDLERLESIINNVLPDWSASKSSSVEYGEISNAFFMLNKTLELINKWRDYHHSVCKVVKCKKQDGRIFNPRKSQS